jgi:hypothetical protein
MHHMLHPGTGNGIGTGGDCNHARTALSEHLLILLNRSSLVYPIQAHYARTLPLRDLFSKDIIRPETGSWKREQAPQCGFVQPQKPCNFWDSGE